MPPILLVAFPETENTEAGILGLAFPSLSFGGIEPFFDLRQLLV